MGNDLIDSSGMAGKSRNNSRDIYSRHDLRTYIQNSPDTHPLFMYYLRKLWVRYSSLRPSMLAGLPVGEESISLPSVYTALNTKTDILISREKDATSGSSARFIPSEGSYLSQRILVESSHLAKHVRLHTRPITALEMLEYDPRLVLVGPAGSGKSTFIHFVTLCMVGEVLERTEANLEILNGDIPPGIPEPWPHGALLPICVELRMFVRSGCFPAEGTRGTANHLLEYIGSTLLPRRDPDVVNCLQEETGSVLLMLDGLDEVPEAHKNRERTREVITDLAQRYPQCRILVTSRPYAYRDSAWRLDQAGFHEATLAELNESQIREFVWDWYKCLNECGLVDADMWEKRAGKLVASIAQWPYLKELAVNPLLLTMVAAVNERSGGALPMNRSKLYEESVELLLDRWNRQRGISVPAVSVDLGTKPEAIRDKLEEIAFEVHRELGTTEGAADITYERLSRALEAISSEPKAPTEQIMNYLHQRSGILVADSPRIFRFPHRSFQEYMAACHLSRRDDYPDLVANLAMESPSVWREVLLFVAWRAATFRQRDVWELIAELCPDPVPDHVADKAEWWGALLAGLVLTETNLHRQETPRRHRTLLARIRGWLTACVESGAMPTQERVEVGRILGCIGDPRPGVGLREDGIPDIEWVEIPAGPFLRGSTDEDERAFGNEMPQQEIQLDAYRISKHEITVAQFRAYVESGDCPASRRTEIQRRWREDPESYVDNYPIVDVNFSDATEFCKWLGSRLGYAVRLPTEEEWEKAARSNDGRIYPWGNEFDSNRCNVSNSVGGTCAVGLFPEGASPYGVMDMSGNVWEWTSSLWKADFGAPVGSGTFNEVRGGSFGDDPKVARCAYHGNSATDGLLVGQGFRVATPHKAEQE